MLTKRVTLKAKKAAKLTKKYLSGSGKSKYNKKRRFLNANGGSGIDYPTKPWR